MFKHKELLAKDVQNYGFDFLSRFFSRIRYMDNGCIEWTDRCTASGYGMIPYKGKDLRVHRVAKALSGVDIPFGMVCDHLCKNTKCVNPDHLEVVTNEENVMRGSGVFAKNAVKTHCDRGHDLKEHGYAFKAPTGKTWRRCKACQRVRGFTTRRRLGVPERTLKQRDL